MAEHNIEFSLTDASIDAINNLWGLPIIECDHALTMAERQAIDNYFMACIRNNVPILLQSGMRVTGYYRRPPTE
jgi:hypothetical protein